MNGWEAMKAKKDASKRLLEEKKQRERDYSPATAIGKGAVRGAAEGAPAGPWAAAGLGIWEAFASFLKERAKSKGEQSDVAGIMDAVKNPAMMFGGALAKGKKSPTPDKNIKYEPPKTA